MTIDEFNILLCVAKCPKCGQDPENMIIEGVDEDSVIVKCDNCSTMFRATYKTEIL